MKSLELSQTKMLEMEKSKLDSVSNINSGDESSSPLQPFKGSHEAVKNKPVGGGKKSPFNVKKKIILF